MDSVVSVLSWIWYNFFDRAAMFMMVLVFIGQLLTKRPFLESLMGALKAYIGYIVYQTATGGLYTTFQPIMMGLRQVLGMSIIVNDDSLGAGTLTAILESFGRTTSLQMASMAAGFGIAIILVLMKKYTKCRSLIIQAHILSGQAIDMVPILLVMFPVMGDFATILAVGLYLAVKWCVLSNLTVEPAQDLTDGANMCVGHTQMILDRLGYEYGRLLERRAKKKGKEVKKFDNLELPGFLSIFNDMYVASFIVMLAYFAVLISLIGKEAMMGIDSSLTADTSFALYIFHTAGKFPVYLVILLTGMRMFVAELTVAFSGISEKVLPNTLPGIDCAAFYGFVTNGSVITVSFLVGSLTMTVFTTVGMLLNLPFVCLVGFVPMMFDSATVGIFAITAAASRHWWSPASPLLCPTCSWPVSLPASSASTSTAAWASRWITPSLCPPSPPCGSILAGSAMRWCWSSCWLSPRSSISRTRRATGWPPRTGSSTRRSWARTCKALC